MRTGIRMLGAMFTLAGALSVSAQQPFMLPSNGNTTNVPSSTSSPGVSSVFYNTLVNKQNTSFMLHLPTLSNNPPFTLTTPAQTTMSFSRLQNLMLNPSSSGNTGGQSYTVFSRTPPPSTGSSWKWFPWSR